MPSTYPRDRLIREYIQYSCVDKHRLPALLYANCNHRLVYVSCGELLFEGERPGAETRPLPCPSRVLLVRPQDHTEQAGGRSVSHARSLARSLRRFREGPGWPSLFPGGAARGARLSPSQPANGSAPRPIPRPPPPPFFSPGARAVVCLRECERTWPARGGPSLARLSGGWLASEWRADWRGRAGPDDRCLSLGSSLARSLFLRRGGRVRARAGLPGDTERARRRRQGQEAGGRGVLRGDVHSI